MRQRIISFLDYISRLSSKRIIFILVVLVAVAYLNSLSVYFIWDDYAAVVSNANIRNPSLNNILKPLYQDDSPSVAKAPVYFRPLQVLSYALDYRVWRLNPLGYHVTNIILHAANTVLLYLLLSFLFKDSLFAFLGSALAAVNPIFTSSVTYISGRGDILSIFFVLLTCIGFIKGIQENKLSVLFYCLSLFFSFFLLLSREIGGVCVLFLIMIDKLVFKYSNTKPKNFIYIPFLLILLSWQYLKPAAAAGFHLTAANLLGAPLGFLTLLKGMSIYTFLAIIPFHLRMGRSITIISTLQDAWVYVSLIFLIVIIALCIMGMRKNKLIIFGLFWFYAPLFIMLLFNYFFAKKDTNIMLPEHNLYFSYAGLIILFLAVITSLKLKINARRLLASVFLFFIIFYAGLTISENFIWQDEIRFFQTNIKYNRDSAFNFMTYVNLGFAYERAKKFRQAEESFKLAAERSGRNPYFYNMLASFYIQQRDFDKALKTLMFSKGLDMSFYNTYVLLGISHAGQAGAVSRKRLGSSTDN